MINKHLKDHARLLVLTSTFPRWDGDVEPGFVHDLCRHLAADAKITVLAPHAPGASNHETLNGVDVVRFHYGPERWELLAYNGGIIANLRKTPLLCIMLPAFFIAQLFAALSLIRRIRPVAVHAHWMVPQGIILATARILSRAQPRAICTAHGSDVSALRGSFWRILRRWVTLRCDHIVTVSEALKVQLTNEGCPPERIGVIPMGTDLHNLFVPDESPRSSTEIVFVGRLVFGKGADILIRALPSILAQQPETTLTMVGNGPERNNLSDLAKLLQVEDRVFFTGPVNHTALATHYRRAALMVLPSREEGFGLVLVEALGCGCPVVASNLPAIRSLLADGLGGSLVRPGDVGDLARAVSELLADEYLRHRLADIGRQHVLSRYDWDTISRRHVSMLMPNAPTKKNGTSDE